MPIIVSTACVCGNPSSSPGMAECGAPIALVHTPTLYNGAQHEGGGIDRAGCLSALARGYTLVWCTP